MKCSIFRFGAVYLDGKMQCFPQHPVECGDIPMHDGKSKIFIKAASQNKNKGIAWVKPDGLNLLVADRALLTDVSWDFLHENGFVEGTQILLGGQRFLCRLLHVGKNDAAPNEWDRILDATYAANSLWNWKDLYFWGANVSEYDSSQRAMRGFHGAYFWDHHLAGYRRSYIGFRPALEPLGPDSSAPIQKLDGTDFRWRCLPGGAGFCPVLRPCQDVFANVPDGQQVKMYTVQENGRPVHIGEQIRDASRLTLTDCYFGDEYLIPWTISNGIAVASQLLTTQY